MPVNDLTPLQTLLAETAPRDRSALLPLLHAAQGIYGYLPEGVTAEIARAIHVPLADVHGVIEFYSMFYNHPVGKTILRVCVDPACAMRGGEELLEALLGHLGTTLDQATPDGAFTVERAPCLGLCDHAPAVMVGDAAIGHAGSIEPQHICRGKGNRPCSTVGGDVNILTSNCGNGKPTDLAEYQAKGGYQALQTALRMGPQSVIDAVKRSGLVGRGGAAFPTGVKWQGAAQAPGQVKYVVCNADESEPGTFKDRVLLEDDPHSVLEGLAIAAYAIGAEKGFIYVRGEYPAAYHIIEQAVQEAYLAGFLGKHVLGSRLSIEVEMRLGAGAYICGEETALFESIEGKRGFPRLKPPFPTTYGLFGQPTVINNVETLCNVPFIIQHGVERYRQLGTEQSPGTKLFCLSGDIARPGLYEVPFGVTLRHLIYELAGGMRGEQDLQAVLLGGAAGVFAVPDQLDVRLSFEDLREAGLPLGSGVVMVFNESRDLRQVLFQLGRFFAHESCGKCYPCQLGTQRQYEILQRVAKGSMLPGDTQRLSDVGWTMAEASICGLGQTAASAVLSALKLWPELFSEA
jgi:NADH-quinone oxidoreductase subunit F